MRVCPNCGKEQPDGTAFCGECGTKLEETESVEKAASSEETSNETAETDEAKSENEEESAGTSTDTLDDAEQASAEPDSASEAAEVSDASEVSQSTESKDGETKSKGLSRNRIIGIIVAVVAVIVVVIIVLVVALGGNSGPSDEQVRSDFEQNNSYFLQTQSVNMQYVNNEDDDKKYELTDFTIDDRDDTGSYYRISFSGAKENASFRVEFRGTVDYENNSNGWTVIRDSFSTQEDGVRPIKGVDKFTPFETGERGLSLYNPDNYQVSDNYDVTKFESSDPEETDGVYTTEATQNVTYNLGFGTETLTSTTKFTFDPSSIDTRRWVKEDDIPEISNDVFTWNLAGRTFSLPDDNTLLNSYGTVSSSLTFNDVSEDGNAVVNYTIDFLPSNSEVDSLGYVAQEVHLSGTATGTMQHNPAASQFDFEFTDNSQNVQLYGTGEANYLTLSVQTEAVYRKEVQLTIFPDYTLSLFEATYVEG